MLCKNPYFIGAQPCECRKCVPCRVQKTRMWANRLMLESRSHLNASFVTLTYSDSNVPVVAGKNIPTLEPDHVKLFLKRLRHRTNQKLRYFYVGEYGDVTNRPHYHLALFGFPSCENGRTNHLNKRCCTPCVTIGETWGLGGVDVGELTEQSAKYIAGYCEKKWKEEKQCQSRKTPSGMNRPKYLLDGRHKEFHQMSLRPGIGAIAIKSLVTFGVQSQRAKSVVKSIDAPVVLRNNGRLLPLGRYLRRKWREALGRKPDTPESVLREYRQELSRLLKESEFKYPSGIKSNVRQRAAFHHWKQNAQKALSLESRAKIYAKGKSL